MPAEKKAKSDKNEQKPKKVKKAKKNKVAADEEPSPDEPIDPQGDAPSRGLKFSWKQHPSMRYGDVFRLDVEAKLQEDGHSSYGPVKGLDPWEFHRNRLGIKGYLTKQIEYEIEHEFTEHELTEKDLEVGITPKSRWKDVYVNFTYVKNAQVKLGKFKVPFGLDQLTGVTHNDFVYRSLGANYLDPGRDIGGMVHGSFWKHGLEYATGVFAHDGDNAKSKKIEGGGTTFAARFNGTPFRRLSASSIGSINVGSAIAISALSDDSFRPNGLRGRTIMTQDDFYESVYVTAGGGKRMSIGRRDGPRRVRSTPGSATIAWARGSATRTCLTPAPGPGMSRAPGCSPAKTRSGRSRPRNRSPREGLAPSSWPSGSSACGSTARRLAWMNRCAIPVRRRFIRAGITP